MSDDEDDKRDYTVANMAPANDADGIQDDEVPEEGGDVEDTDDGGAIVSYEMEDAVEDISTSEHFENLADSILSDAVLSSTSATLLDMIERDKEARKRRDEQYREGIQRTGLGDDAPGGAEFEGASKVVHPILTEVCVDFSARSMKELFPAAGPVKDYIPGKITQPKLEKAKRKTRLLNYQLTKKMPEFRSELEQTLTQVPLGGVQYIKLWHDRRLKRPMAQSVTVDDILIPFAATSFRSAQRKTHVQYFTELEVQQKIKDGEWRDVDLSAPDYPEQSESAEASDKIEGRETDAYNPDGLRIVYEVACILDLEEEGEAWPYLVTIDESTRRVLSVYRNWLPGDEMRQELQHIVEFPFVPWRGAYPIGIAHMIGGLSAAATGALRALLDSAHISNFPTALKLSGVSGSGQSIELNPTEIKEIEGSFAADDIRKVIMPMPFNPPSPVLFQLLGFLVDAGKGVVQTTFENLADQKTDMPVGTTLALIEQGMTVFSAIHARLHNAMAQLLEILHRINALYLDDQETVDDAGELLAKREDFQGPMDVIPVSDPNIFSETQRFAQVQAIAARAQQNPLYDQRKVEELILERLKVPNAKDLLVPKPEPQHLNAVNENFASLMGRPVVAFPDQDHMAHLMTHALFIQHPLFGKNPLVAPKVIGALLPHLAEHLGFLYVTDVFERSSAAAGMDISELIDTKDEEMVKAFDATMQQASAMALQQLQQDQNLMSLLQVISEGMQFLQSMQQPPPMDPSQVAAQEVQRKSQADAQKAQLDAQKVQTDQQRLALEAQRQQREEAADAEQRNFHQQDLALRARTAQAGVVQQQQNMLLDAKTAAEDRAADLRKAEMDNRADMAINTADNQTALTIAAAEIESGERTALSTGGGVNPGNGSD